MKFFFMFSPIKSSRKKPKIVSFTQLTYVLKGQRSNIFPPQAEAFKLLKINNCALGWQVGRYSYQGPWNPLPVKGV